MLVFGGVRGLGLATARALAARGARVHVTWRSSAERADALRAELAGVHACDAAQPDEVARVVEAVLASEGRLDRVVHTIGAYSSGALEATPATTAAALWGSNVLTALHVIEACRAALRASRGAFLFFGCAGLDGHRARRECAAYAAAKSALLVVVRSLAVEEAPFGVRANMLSPGIIPHDAAHPDTLDPGATSVIPLGRAGRPDEIAAAALHLLDATHTTGIDLAVAGGWLL